MLDFLSPLPSCFFIFGLQFRGYSFIAALLDCIRHEI